MGAVLNSKGLLLGHDTQENLVFVLGRNTCSEL